LSVELLSARELPGVARIWKDLDERFGQGSLSSSWDWTDTWLRRYGDVVPHRIAIAERAGAVCGIALVTRSSIRRGPVRINRLHLGTAGEPVGEGVHVEYNRLLGDPEHTGAFATALLHTLRGIRRWDELCLNGFAIEDAAPLVAAEAGFAASRVPSPVLDLRPARSDQGDVLALLPSGARSRLRRTMRHFGQIDTEWAETPAHALEILGELIDLHQRRWSAAGLPGAFSSARFTAFHRELAERLVGRGTAVLFRARAGSETLGCLYGFIERGRLLFYQSGFASFTDNRLKPGLAVHTLCMEQCLRRGLDEYDFLAGDARYKRELSTGERTLVWAVLRRGRVKWRTLDALLWAREQSRALDHRVHDPDRHR
jgi:CelD/BcsL family acetyltransferase involved in cellulose biosynthesis